MQDNKQGGFQEEFSPVEAFNRMSESATKLNALFGQNRERIVELMEAVSNATPGIVRLGGDAERVFKILEATSNASRRNVISNTETVEKLFAANQLIGLLGDEGKNVMESFLNVGIGIEQIPEKLEDAVNYVRSVGLNTKVVMTDVSANLDKLNRYQFEGGIQGLTKMAAQASMLRFDMKKTFDLAEKVMDPDKAVEVASSLQRLGVTAGNLVDPFQLMNLSINDPSGLQDSLAEITKQYSYFDEKTKTFKINPQGVLMLRELGKTLDIETKELMEMSIASKELETRLSAISSAGLTIASEEDKQYLANIVQMDKEGKYIVTLEDNTKKELSELKQDEFDKLIEIQKTGPKSLEDLARAQLTTTDLMYADVNAILQKLSYGLASTRQITTGTETFRNFVGTTTGAFSSSTPGIRTKDVRSEFERLISNLTKGGTDFFADKTKSPKDILSEIFEKLKDQMGDVRGKMNITTNELLKDIANKNAQGNEAQKKYAEFLNSIISGEKKFSIGGIDFNKLMESLSRGELPITTKNENKPNTSDLNPDISTFLFGKTTTTNPPIQSTPGNVPKGFNSPIQATTLPLQNAKVDFGELKIKVLLPDNFNQFTKEGIEKIVLDLFGTPDFKQRIKNLTTVEDPTKAPVAKR